MFSMEALKKKGDELSLARSKNSGPSSKYTPSGLDYVGPTMEERIASSKYINGPTYGSNASSLPPLPPPIRRGATLDSEATTASPPPRPSTSSKPIAPSARYGAAAPPASPPSLPRRSSGGAPPAPPPRSGSGASASRPTPAPPYQHAVAHDMPIHEVMEKPGGKGWKPFSQYGEEDKAEFFSMLDEVSCSFGCVANLTDSMVPQFFSSKMDLNGSSRSSSKTPSPARLPIVQPSLAPPPTAPSSTRPTPAPRAPLSPSGPSYPLPQPHSSSALTTLHYILYSSYTTPWYTLPTPMPPPLTTRNDIRWTGSWSQRGDEKNLLGYCLFGDCSVAWWRLTWSASAEARGTLDERSIKREGRYRPIPEAWDGEALYAASETYGPSLVGFAERALAGRRAVGRGECWDVAAEGLESITEGRRPCPSIARTHGHLIYWARAGGKGEGVWRGGDPYVRAGDIVEWRTVRIREVGMQEGAYSTLGDPEVSIIFVVISWY